MAPIDRRVRLWAWLVRRQGSFDTKSDAEVIAMQSRPTPSNAVTDRIFGAVVPGTQVRDRVIDGPARDIPVRVYRPARAGSGARPLIVNFHGLPPALIQVAELGAEQKAALAQPAAAVPR